MSRSDHQFRATLVFWRETNSRTSIVFGEFKKPFGGKYHTVAVLRSPSSSKWDASAAPFSREHFIEVGVAQPPLSTLAIDAPVLKGRDTITLPESTEYLLKHSMPLDMTIQC